MIHELIYTSAPKGLRPGTQGFCTVATTAGIPKRLVEVLESISSYKHVHGPGEAQASLNPVVYSHLKLNAAGQRFHVLSRVADADVDYSGRSNNLAQHVVVEANDRVPAGPAWLMSRANFFDSQWSGPPRILEGGRRLPAGRPKAAVCTAWETVTGDAGWAGALAQTATSNIRQVAVIFRPGTDLLPLLTETLNLLDEHQRWEVTFSTYFTKLPPGIDCKWRFVLAGTPEAESVARGSQMVIDLANGPGLPAAGPLVEAARTGAVSPLAAGVSLPPPTLSSPDAAAPRSSPVYTPQPPPAQFATDANSALETDDEELRLAPPELAHNEADAILPPGAASELAASRTRSAQSRPIPPKTRNIVWPVLGLVVTLLVVAGGGAAAVHFFKNDASPAAQTNASPPEASPLNDENDDFIPHLPVSASRNGGAAKNGSNDNPLDNQDANRRRIEIERSLNDVLDKRDFFDDAILAVGEFESDDTRAAFLRDYEKARLSEKYRIWTQAARTQQDFPKHHLGPDFREKVITLMAAVQKSPGLAPPGFKEQKRTLEKLLRSIAAFNWLAEFVRGQDDILREKERDSTRLTRLENTADLLAPWTHRVTKIPLLKAQVVEPENLSLRLIGGKTVASKAATFSLSDTNGNEADSNSGQWEVQCNKQPPVPVGAFYLEGDVFGFEWYKDGYEDPSEISHQFVNCQLTLEVSSIFGPEAGKDVLDAITIPLRQPRSVPIHFYFAPRGKQTALVSQDLGLPVFPRVGELLLDLRFGGTSPDGPEGPFAIHLEGEQVEGEQDDHLTGDPIELCEANQYGNWRLTSTLNLIPSSRQPQILKIQPFQPFNPNPKAIALNELRKKVEGQIGGLKSPNEHEDIIDFNVKINGFTAARDKANGNIKLWKPLEQHITGEGNKDERWKRIGNIVKEKKLDVNRRQLEKYFVEKSTFQNDWKEWHATVAAAKKDIERLEEDKQARNQELMVEQRNKSARYMMVIKRLNSLVNAPVTGQLTVKLGKDNESYELVLAKFTKGEIHGAEPPTDPADTPMKPPVVERTRDD